jgi:hypothetical protein
MHTTNAGHSIQKRSAANSSSNTRWIRLICCQTASKLKHRASCQVIKDQSMVLDSKIR